MRLRLCCSLAAVLLLGGAPLGAEDRDSSRVPASLTQAADEQYDRGRALAAEGLRHDAAAAFRAGERLAPGDARFPTELAALAFLDERYSDAKSHLQRALRLKPADPYLIDFLATVYLLQGNLDAAVHHWNRIGKPRIEQVHLDASPRTDAVMLDRAFAVSPASVLRLPDLELTRARLDNLDIHSRERFELLAREDQTFDLSFQGLDRTTWRESKLGAALSLLRGVSYQTVFPEFFNVDGRGLNLRSLVRWDPRKQRLHLSISKPLYGEPGRRFRFFADGRSEDWVVGGMAESGAQAAFGLKKAEAGVEFTSVVNQRFTWTAGAVIATREYGDEAALAPSDASSAQDLFGEGLSLNTLLRLDVALLRDYDRRLTIDGAAEWRLGRLWDPDAGLYSRWTQSATLRWFPLDEGDDYAVQARWRSGQTFGRAPFDELYTLGLDRDTDLWLRGHRAIENGYKGAGLLGDRFLLSNVELDKTVYRHPLLTVTAGPFLDAGSVDDWRGLFGSSGWRWDAGLQCKAKVAGGLTVGFSYGRNLQSGSDAFFWTILRE